MPCSSCAVRAASTCSRFVRSQRRVDVAESPIRLRLDEKRIVSPLGAAESLPQPRARAGRSCEIGDVYEILRKPQ
jgi:hypothetical protein